MWDTPEAQATLRRIDRSIRSILRFVKRSRHIGNMADRVWATGLMLEATHMLLERYELGSELRIKNQNLVMRWLQHRGDTVETKRISRWARQHLRQLRTEVRQHITQ